MKSRSNGTVLAYYCGKVCATGVFAPVYITSAILLPNIKNPPETAGVERCFQNVRRHSHEILDSNARIRLWPFFPLYRMRIRLIPFNLLRRAKADTLFAFRRKILKSEFRRKFACSLQPFPCVFIAHPARRIIPVVRCGGGRAENHFSCLLEVR